MAPLLMIGLVVGICLVCYRTWFNLHGAHKMVVLAKHCDTSGELRLGMKARIMVTQNADLK